MTLPISLLSSARACLEELSTRRPTREEARAIRLLVAPAKARRAVKASRKRREERREGHAEETARIRGEVMQRAGGRCERCGLPCDPTAAHLHHLRGGSGRRRQEQSMGTCAALCPTCHEGMHHDPLRARAWGAGFMERLRIEAAHPRKEEGR